MGLLDSNRVLPLERKGEEKGVDCSVSKWVKEWLNIGPAKVLELKIDVSDETPIRAWVGGTYNNDSGFYSYNVKTYKRKNEGWEQVTRITEGGLYLVDLCGCNYVGLHNESVNDTTMDVYWYLRNDDILSTSTNIKIGSFLDSYAEKYAENRGGIDLIFSTSIQSVADETRYGGSDVFGVALNRKYKFVFTSVSVITSTGETKTINGSLVTYFCIETWNYGPALVGKVDVSGDKFVSEWQEVRGLGVRHYLELSEAIEEGCTITLKIFGVS